MTSPAPEAYPPGIPDQRLGQARDPGPVDPTDLSAPADPFERLALLDVFGEPFVRDPHPWLELLRTASPVHHDPGTGLWLVSRHEDVRRVLLEPEEFLPDNAQHAVTPLPVPVLRILARAGFALPPALANNGTGSHTGLRRLVTRFFHARRVEAAVPVIERIAGELLAGVRSGSPLDGAGSRDLFASYAQILPCRVLMELLGIEDVEPATLIRWSDASLELFYGRPAPERQLELGELVGEFHRWLTATVRSGTVPEDSFIGALRRHRLPGGEPLDVRTAVAACFFVFIAGQSTTGQLIATVLHRVSAEPDLWSRVATEAGLAEAWVEEVLRREPPVTTWRRVTARATSLGGVRLPAGAPLLLLLMGSGSDPDVFPEPAEMCPYRPNVRHHLAFGAGRHRCPGASLARTEATVALRAAARALPGVRPADGAEPPLLGLLSFRAPLAVPVRLPEG
ncbi:cytochrome P450 [Streptomyces sp. NPDC004787]|uniref:cytochrome P450 n=1 Tax=Streptomyces sp. NPDC004787 TaxID=3154291 RepID=UPI0033B0D542